MWQTMVSEPSLAEVVLETLLQKWPKPKHDGLGPGHNCTGYLAVSFWMTPRSPLAGLHSPRLLSPHSLSLPYCLLPPPPCSPTAALCPLFPCPSNPSMSPHGLGQHGRGSCTLRAILGCFLQISHALHAILHLPSTEDSAWQLIHKLYVGMLFQIFFMLQCKQRGCFSPIASDEDMSPVNIIRCSIPAAGSLPQAQSQGFLCDARFAVSAGMRWRA